MPAPRPGRRVTSGLLATAAVALVAPVPARAAAPAPCSPSAAWSCTVAGTLAAAQSVRWDLAGVGAPARARSLAGEPSGPVRTDDVAARRSRPAVLHVQAAPGSHVLVQAVGADTGTQARRWDVTVPDSGIGTVVWDGTGAAGPLAGGRYVFRLSRADTDDRTPVETADVEVGSAVFPIAGPHDWGRSEANKFGGGRGHKGLDMFAACGTPVVAAAAGRVEKAAYEGAAGNYVVIALPDRRANVYMHLRHPARVHKGDGVTAGRRLGSVGRTGDADGCHLHFELWTAPGWFRGRAVDPEPLLRRIAAAAK